MSGRLYSYFCPQAVQRAVCISSQWDLVVQLLHEQRNVARCLFSVLLRDVNHDFVVHGRDHVQRRSGRV